MGDVEGEAASTDWDQSCSWYRGLLSLRETRPTVSEALGV